MSRKTKEYDLEVRGQAVGMLEAGSRTQKVAEQLGVSLRTVQYWWADLRRMGACSKRGGPAGLRFLEGWTKL